MDLVYVGSVAGLKKYLREKIPVTTLDYEVCHEFHNYFETECPACWKEREQCANEE